MWTLRQTWRPRTMQEATPEASTGMGMRRMATVDPSWRDASRAMTALVLAGPTGLTEHDGGPRHPERPARLAAVMDGVRSARAPTGDRYPGLRRGADGCADARARPRPTSPSWLRSARKEAVTSTPTPTRGRTRGPQHASRQGQGWPPSRHWTNVGRASPSSLPARPAITPPADRAMGFCLINSVAVAAASRTAIGERVLIVDWDVHHGNGTQDIFWDDPDVLYVSTHQHPLYPGTGRPAEVGGPSAPGLTLNFPLPPGATGDIVRAALDERGAARPSRRSRRTGCSSRAGSTPTATTRSATLALSSGDFAELARSCARSLRGRGASRSSSKAATRRPR